MHQNHRAIILSFLNIDCFCYNSIPIQHRRLDAPEHSPDKYSPEQDKLSSWQVPSLARQAESAPDETKNQFYANDKILHENLLPFNFCTLYCLDRRYISTYQSEKLSRQDVNQQSIIQTNVSTLDDIQEMGDYCRLNARNKARMSFLLNKSSVSPLSYM